MNDTEKTFLLLVALVVVGLMYEWSDLAGTIALGVAFVVGYLIARAERIRKEAVEQARQIEEAIDDE